MVASCVKISLESSTVLAFVVVDHAKKLVGFPALSGSKGQQDRTIVPHFSRLSTVQILASSGYFLLTLQRPPARLYSLYLMISRMSIDSALMCSVSSKRVYAGHQ